MIQGILPDFDNTCLEILPKRNETRPINTMGLVQESFRTNCYEIQVTEKSLFLYQYHIQTDPVIPSDSTKVWYKLVKNIQSKLQKYIGLISHRANALWGNKYLQGQTLDLIWISKYKTKVVDESDLMETQSLASSSVTFTQSSVSPSSNTLGSMEPINQSQVSSISKVSQSFSLSQSQSQDTSKPRYKETETKYRVSIKLTNKLDLQQLLTDEKEKGKIIQIINIKIKDKLQSLGYLQLGKGRFYEKSKFQQDYIEQVGLQVLRGYRFSLMSLPNNRLCLQIDPCTRILQSHNLLEVIQNMGKQASIRLKNSVVISRYGNYKTYKIDDIDYKKNPGSFFYIHEVRKGKKPGERAPKIKKTYAQYFKEAYGITVRNMKQPLVRIIEKPIKIIKRQKIRQKPSYTYLIPQLLSLTGMTIKQRNDKNAMKAIAPYTKLTPKARFIESQKIIHQIQSFDKANQRQDGKQDFSMIKIKQPTVVKGFQLNPVYVTLKDTQKIEGGQFNIRQPLLKPAKFQDWILFCSNGTKPQRLKQFIKYLDQASKQLGITLKDPFISVINYSQTDRDFMSKQNLWIAGLQKQLKKGKPPQIIVLYLQSYQQNFYSEIKREAINKYGVLSQVVKASTFEKQGGTLSISTGIVVQMNQKIGQTVWKIQRNHPQFKQKTFQVFSMAKKPKVQETINQSMISQSSSKKSDKQHKHEHKERKHRKDKEEKDEKKQKKQKKHKKERKPGPLEGQTLLEQSILPESSFAKSSTKKVSQINDLSQSLSYPSAIIPFPGDISSIHAQNNTLTITNESKFLGESSILEKSSNVSSIIQEADESSQITEKNEQKKVKKEKKQKKDKQQKKQKKQKKQKREVQEKPSESISQVVSSKLQYESKQSLTQSQVSNGNKSNKSGKSGKHKKEKKDKKEKKQKQDKKQKDHKKQKYQKESKAQQQKPRTVCYEDILIKKQQKKMAQAKKKIIDQAMKLQLTSDLQIACAGFSSSTSSANGKFTMSFVGTTNRDQTQVYTHCRYGLRRKDYLPDLQFELIFNYWLKTYYEKSVHVVDGIEKHFMPSVLVIYRQGLSDDQLKKQIYRQVRILKKVIRQKVPKSLNYDPQIIYITVNKRVNTRFFDNATKDAKNAIEGSVIFDQFARNNTMDFHLISQHVQNADGTSIPVQYRVAYRNRFQLSEAALAQFTYQQCHNYYNWAGAVRIPAVLQCAGKLSRLVGEKVRQNVFRIGGKKKSQKPKQPVFKLLGESSVSSVGNETLDMMNKTNLSMSNTFSLFGNNESSLTNSQASSNLSQSNVSGPKFSLSNVSSDVQLALPATNQFNFQSGKGFRTDNKKFDFKKKDDRKVDESMDMSKKLDFRKGGDRKFDRTNKTINLTVQKRVHEEKPDRQREIIDTFFFL